MHLRTLISRNIAVLTSILALAGGLVLYSVQRNLYDSAAMR